MFDIRQSISNEHGDHDEGRKSDYMGGLADAFAESAEGRAFSAEHGRIGYAHMFLDYYFDYIGGDLTQITVADFNEVVFDLIPAKVSTSPDNAARIIAELRAFWTFIERQYGLMNARAILVTLPGAEKELHEALADNRNWGMAKSFVMGGIEAGYDMATQEGMNAFKDQFNASLQSRPTPRLTTRLDPVSIETLPAPRVGLNREERRREKKRQRQARKRARSS